MGAEEEWAPSVYLNYDCDVYRDIAAALSAFHYGDGDTVEELLDGAGSDWPKACLVMMHACVREVAAHVGTSVEAQLRHFGWAAAAAARDER